MKQFKLNFYFIDGNAVSVVVDEAELDNLRKAINESGFNITFLVADGVINLNHICHLKWEEQ